VTVSPTIYLLTAANLTVELFNAAVDRARARTSGPFAFAVSPERLAQLHESVADHAALAGVDANLLAPDLVEPSLAGVPLLVVADHFDMGEPSDHARARGIARSLLLRAEEEARGGDATLAATLLGQWMNLPERVRGKV
jgi:hypothetical protein